MSSRPVVKRSRQLSIFESFENSKFPKRRNLMDDQAKADMRERLASAAEKRISSHDSKPSREKDLKSPNKNESESPNKKDSKSPREKEMKDTKKSNANLSADNISSNSSRNIDKPSSKISTDALPNKSISTISSRTLKMEHNNTEESKRDNLNANKEQDDDKVLSQSANSEDLFPDSFPDDFNCSQSSNKENTPSPKEKFPVVSDLNRWPKCAVLLPQMVASSSHTILFRPHFREGCAPRPYPDSYRDQWDGDHVRMPCSPLNQCPVTFPDGQKVIQNRWDLICRSLSQPMESSDDIQRTILQYNSQYAGKWNFLGLHSFFSKHLKSTQRAFFFEKILPEMASLALKLPEIVTHPIPLLKKHTEHSITMSQKQVACLLANAFFCTFPRRNTSGRWQRDARRKSEYASYPSINFNRLFYGTKDGISQRNAEKLKCLLNYFLRITEKEPTGTVTFHRKYNQVFPNWACSVADLEKAVIVADGLIETEGNGMLQVDFANSYVGGGVLGQGCIQEEIRFTICPELIASMLFTEQLTDCEALVVTGVEQYNDYTGYGDSFEWNGNYIDTMSRDSWGRKFTQVVAIDATPFRNTSDQYKLTSIKRELNKAYVGFSDSSVPKQNLTAVATGNWGCGAYKGNPNLKFLIQLMAASQAGRGVLYFTFEDKNLQDSLDKMYKFIKRKQFNVGSLWALFSDYFYDVMGFRADYRPKLYEYIYGIHSSRKKDEEVEEEKKEEEDEESAKTESTLEYQLVIDETPDFDIHEYDTDTDEN